MNTKIKLDSYRKIIRKTFDRKIPFKCIWEITKRCNLNCLHCFLDKNDIGKELSFEQIKKILEILKTKGTLFLSFTGGEPLTREDFFKIAFYAQKLNFALRLLTNATLINESNIKEIKRLNLLSCEISLYSMDADIHDEITKSPGSFNKTFRAISLLKKKDINIIIKTPIMKQNYLTFFAVKEFCQKEKLKFIYDPILLIKDNGDRSILKYRLNQEQIDYIISKNLVPEDDIIQGKASLDEPFCSAGQNGFCIDSQGNLLPCIGIRESMGNLLKENFDEIWSSERINFIRNIRLKDLTVCKDCKYLDYCRRCSGSALLEDGDIFGPVISSCMLAKATYKARISNRNTGAPAHKSASPELQEVKCE